MIFIVIVHALIVHKNLCEQWTLYTRYQLHAIIIKNTVHGKKSKIKKRWNIKTKIIILL